MSPSIYAARAVAFQVVKMGPPVQRPDWGVAQHLRASDPRPRLPVNPHSLDQDQAVPKARPRLRAAVSCSHPHPLNQDQVVAHLKVLAAVFQDPHRPPEAALRAHCGLQVAALYHHL